MCGKSVSGNGSCTLDSGLEFGLAWIYQTQKSNPAKIKPWPGLIDLAKGNDQNGIKPSIAYIILNKHWWVWFFCPIPTFRILGGPGFWVLTWIPRKILSKVWSNPSAFFKIENQTAAILYISGNQTLSKKIKPSSNQRQKFGIEHKAFFGPWDESPSMFQSRAESALFDLNDRDNGQYVRKTMGHLRKRCIYLRDNGGEHIPWEWNASWALSSFMIFEVVVTIFIMFMLYLA